MTTLQAKMGFQDSDLKTPGHDKIMLWVHAHAVEVWNAVLPDYPLTESTTKIVWEVPIKPSGSTYTVGFADMVIADWLVIEVKTHIPNVGELLRQLNLYRHQSYWHERPFVVVSPDDRFADVLRSQGIAFYKYEQTPEDEAMQ